MLTIFKEKIGELRSPEKFFDINMGTFDFDLENNQLILRVMENAQVKNGVYITPFGKGKLSEMKTATKLALCLTNYPGFLFSAEHVNTSDLAKIMVLPEGSLFLELDKPFPYLFQVRARTASGVLLNSSTDINIWYFHGRNQW